MKEEEEKEEERWLGREEGVKKEGAKEGEDYVTVRTCNKDKMNQ